jgi:hypothetical protein
MTINQKILSPICNAMIFQGLLRDDDNDDDIDGFF